MTARCQSELVEDCGWGNNKLFEQNLNSFSGGEK
jgi:hypothetical protein